MAQVFLVIEPILPVLKMFITSNWVRGVILFAVFISAILYLKNYRSLVKECEKFNPHQSNENDKKNRLNLGQRFREICLNFEEYLQKKDAKLIFKTDPTSFLVQIVTDEFEKSYLYRFSSVFIGLSLILTFFLIGHSVYDIGISLPTITKENLHKLGNPIAELQQKFFVSIAGILSSILYQWFSAILLRQLTDKAFDNLSLREKVDYLLRETKDLEFQNIQALEARNAANAAIKIANITEAELTGTKNDREEFKKLLRDLKNIEVTVGNFAEDVTTRLESFVDKSIGNKLTQLIQAQTTATEKIATIISEKIGGELEKVFADLANKLPNILSGGANSATMKMTEAVLKASDSFAGISTTIPNLVEQLNLMFKKLGEEQQSLQLGSQKANSQLIEILQNAITNMSEKSRQVMEQQELIIKDLRSITNEISTHMKDSVASMQIQLQNGSTQFVDNVKVIGATLSQSANHVGTLVNEIDQTVNKIRISNSQMFTEFSKAISDVKNVSIQMTSTGQAITESVKSLAELSSHLRQAPNVILGMVEKIGEQLKEQKLIVENYSQSLTTQYQRGVELIVRTTNDNLSDIENRIKAITEVYKAAGGSISSSLDPLESLADEIDDLKTATQELTGVIKNFSGQREIRSA